MYSKSLLPVTNSRVTNKMYSSYGNQRRNANVLRFIPPGFKFPIDVQFPPRGLAVCERCKKNFKTREHCRGRDCHTDLAWCETYVCVSLDNSCSDDDGNLLDGPFAAKVVPPIAFNLKGDLNPLTPICAPCKDKNYTRTYCRQNKNHRQLPWSTVYVIVSLKPGVVPQRTSKPGNKVHLLKRSKPNSEGHHLGTGVVSAQDDGAKVGNEMLAIQNAAIIGNSSNDEFIETGEGGSNDCRDNTVLEGEFNSLSNTLSTEIKLNANKSCENVNSKKRGRGYNYEQEDDIETKKAIEATKLDHIPRSRTFLATVSTKYHRIEWVDIDPVLESQLPMLNENHPDNQVNDAYDMRNTNSMMHPSMTRNVGLDSAGMNVMNEMRTMRNMSNIDMARMRGSSGNSIHNSNSLSGMGGLNNNNGIASLNVPNSMFSDDSHMMGGGMTRLGAQDMMSQMNQMRQMERQMRQMNQMNQIGVDSIPSGAVPYDSQSIPSRMPYSNGGVGLTSQEMMQYEAMRNSRDISHMSFDRSQMVTGIPFHTMNQADFNQQMQMDRMNGLGSQRMSRGGMLGPAHEMMGMEIPGQDFMRSMGGNQEMMRGSAFDRMSGTMGQGMMGMRGNLNNIGGMGGQNPSSNWRAMGDQAGLPSSAGLAYGHSDPDGGHQDGKSSDE